VPLAPAAPPIAVAADLGVEQQSEHRTVSLFVLGCRFRLLQVPEDRRQLLWRSRPDDLLDDVGLGGRRTKRFRALSPTCEIGRSR